MFYGFQQNLPTVADVLKTKPVELSTLLLRELALYGGSFTEEHLLNQSIEAYNSRLATERILQALGDLRNLGFVGTSMTTRNALAVTERGREAARHNQSPTARPKADVTSTPSWISELVAEAKKLEYGNNAALDALVKKTQMLVRKKLGSSASYYTGEIGTGNFYVFSLSEVPEGEARAQWTKGQRELINTLEVIATEVELDSESKTTFSPKVNSTKAIFIGHGRTNDWLELEKFLRERLKLGTQDFNTISSAGIANKERLEELLSSSCFAFVVVTAENAMTDNTTHARDNVIHEVGLFQGRLGFKKAIVLLEEGCEEFSNIQGLGQIRFPKAKISSKFEEVRKVLEREGVYPAGI